MKKKLLIIFTKNPQLGKVKTRLANSIGEQKALSVYKKLLWRTHENVSALTMDICIAYSDYVDKHDIWENDKFEKVLQKGNDLGERMHNSFLEGFEKSYLHICLIGSDIPDLAPAIIEHAFDQLQNNDLVLGPAQDEGYYLIGMNHPIPDLFADIPWSTDEVLKKTLDKAKAQQLKTAFLPRLIDIDGIEDIIKNGDEDYLLS